MTQPRQQQVSLSDTPYYHLICRCVRRSFLCGTDHQTGKNYEYRRQWIEDRIRLLASLYTIDVCAYAVMSNHYHLVVKLSPVQADDSNLDDVLKRWTSLFKGPLLIRKYMVSMKLKLWACLLACLSLLFTSFYSVVRFIWTALELHFFSNPYFLPKTQEHLPCEKEPSPWLLQPY